MKKYVLQFNTLLLVSALLVLTSSASAYDVIRARTVGNEQSSSSIKDALIPTANDPDLPNFSEDQTVASYFKNKTRNLFKRKNKENLQESLEEVVVEDNQNTETETPVIKEKNKFQINADKIMYDDTNGNVYAKGNVEIIAKAQNVVLKSDNAILDKNTQTISLENNVKIIKNGIEMLGDSMIVDLNEENIIMDNPTAEAYSFTIKAQESYMIANELQMLNGSIKCASNKQFPIIPPRFNRYAPSGREMLFDPDIQYELNPDKKKQSYKIDAKEVILTNYKDHSSVLLKGSNVYFNNHKVVPNSDIEIISDKERQVVETNTPEMGTLRSFGTYVGYGVVKRLPKGQTLKVMPALVYGDGNFGLGLIGRHRSRNSLLEAGMSTSTEQFVGRGLYRFGNGFTLRYGRNAYIADGFMGARRSAYTLQLGHEKAYKDDNLGVTFMHGLYGGLYSDYKKKQRTDHHFATSRFRYNMQLSKNLITYKNPEQDLSITLSASAQASATVYGTGDTFGIVRVGPTLRTKLRKWESMIGYYQGGIHGESPFVFDKYRYGRSTIRLNEKFNFKNYFALGYSVMITPNKDNYEKDLITESCFYALFGPDDLKFAVSYDFVRDIGHIDLMFILGSDNTKINFEKMRTENIDSAKQKQDFYKKAKTIKVEDI